MKKSQLTVLMLLFTVNLFGQCTYLSDISGGNNTRVVISIIPSSIIVSSQSCQYGYNFDIRFDYEIKAYQNGNLLSNYSFYTLQGNLVTNKGTLFFDLPNGVSSGTGQTTVNAWNGSGVSDCSSITLSDISIADVKIQIHNADFSNQTSTMNCETPLPIELLYFSSLEEEGKIQLNWATASERNNDYFRLEKSYNGKGWLFLGQIKGSGNSSSKNSYHYIDDFPKLGINYYRLTQFDYDGKSELLGIISSNSTDKKEVVIYPNPVNQYFIISGISDKDEISLFSIEGQKINGLTIEYLNESIAKVNTELLLEGIYIISVGNITKKVIKSFP